jgi:1,4-dihydroxy-2-naphthoate octaprenyltransferase
LLKGSVFLPSNVLGITWRLLRPPTLTASLAPVLVGTGLAIADRKFDFWLFFCMLIASMLIQSGANMINEYMDYKRGLDHKGMVGIAGTIVRDGIAPGVVLAAFWVTIFIAVMLGVYICAHTSWWVAVAGVISMVVMYFYSGGPHPISYTPFGEITAGFFMGPVIVMISYFIESGHLARHVFWISLPIGLLIGAILLANNLRDYDHDVQGGRKTLPIILGKRGGAFLLGGSFILSYVMIILLVATRQVTPWALITLLLVFSTFKIPNRFLVTNEGQQLQNAFKATSLTLIRFSLLLFISLIIGAYIKI